MNQKSAESFIPPREAMPDPIVKLSPSSSNLNMIIKSYLTMSIWEIIQNIDIDNLKLEEITDDSFQNELHNTRDYKKGIERRMKHVILPDMDKFVCDRHSMMSFKSV